MTRLEAIIYAIGRLDEMPNDGVITSMVQLSDCHSCFEKGYRISRVNLFSRNCIYLVKGDPEKENSYGETLMYLDRDAFDIHEVAVLIDNAYGTYLKRHKNE